MKLKKVYKNIKNIKDLYGKYQNRKSGTEELKILLVVDSKDSLTELKYLLLGSEKEENYFKSYTFSEVEEKTEQYLHDIYNSDAVLIYGKDLDKNIDGVSLAIFITSKCSLNWSAILYDSGADIYKKALVEVLNIRKKRIISVRERMNLLEAVAGGLLFSLPEDKIYNSLNIELLSSKIKSELPAISSSMVFSGLVLYALIGSISVPVLISNALELGLIFERVLIKNNPTIAMAAGTTPFGAGYILQRNKKLSDRIITGSILPSLVLRFILDKKLRKKVVSVFKKLKNV